MTTSTPRTNLAPLPAAAGPVFVPDAPSFGGRPGKGFTLVEVLIAATLSTFVLAGVLSAFLFLARTGFRSSGYSEMEAEMRRGLDTFARDTRNATDLHWSSTQKLTLTVSDGTVTYAYDDDPASATYRCFYRAEGNAGQPRTVLIRGLTADFAFQRYKLEQPGVSDNSASNDSETKLLQLTLRAVRTSGATTGASNSAISARYMLRNKRVAH